MSEWVAYTYDGVGNRLTRGTTDYTYDAANQLTLRDASGALTTYSYDVNGNLLAQQKPYAGTTTFTWGYENERLTSLEPDGDLVTMTYDGDLQRRKRAPAAAVPFLAAWRWREAAVRALRMAVIVELALFVAVCLVLLLPIHTIVTAAP